MSYFSEVLEVPSCLARRSTAEGNRGRAGVGEGGGINYRDKWDWTVALPPEKMGRKEKKNYLRYGRDHEFTLPNRPVSRTDAVRCQRRGFGEGGDAETCSGMRLVLFSFREGSQWKRLLW